MGGLLGIPGPSRPAVDVYVHFDPDTLKPGVSKVVQQGIQQAIPALTGVR